jgi:hypothetical protein
MRFLSCFFVVVFVAAYPLCGQVQKAASPEELRAGGGTNVDILEHRMTAEQLKMFLKQRTSCGMLSGSSFDSYASLLWAVSDVGVWSKGADIGSVRLQNPFPTDYRPTWRELMDVLAWQTGCNWHYDHKTGYWVFKKQKPKLPFSIKTAEGWTRRDDGLSVSFIPPVAPVGMDVYAMGHFSSDAPAKVEEVYSNAVRNVSIRFARNFKVDIGEADFTRTNVCSANALYFSAPTPRDAKLKWRQWAFVKKGYCFIIVSVVAEENEGQLLKDINAMMATFEVIGED